VQSLYKISFKIGFNIKNIYSKWIIKVDIFNIARWKILNFSPRNSKTRVWSVLYITIPGFIYNARKRFTCNVTLFSSRLSHSSTRIHERTANWLLAKTLPLFLFVELEKVSNAMFVICICRYRVDLSQLPFNFSRWPHIDDRIGRNAFSSSKYPSNIYTYIFPLTLISCLRSFLTPILL